MELPDQEHKFPDVIKKVRRGLPPKINLTNFHLAMKIAGAEMDHAKCLAFPMTLSGRAATWFTQLTPRSIDSFPDLTHHFDCFRRPFIYL